MCSSSKVQLIVEQVNNSEISSIKQTVTQILAIINDPNSSAKDLKDIIEIDPPLTAKLIKLANSALYGFPKTISEIQDAIVCIGFDAVRELALSQKVCELFQNDEYIHGYTRRSLWKHSVAVALCAKFIFRREFRKSGNNVYVAGLLHDIGIIVIDQFVNDKFKEILQTSRNEKKNIFSIERDILGYNHMEIGLALSENWGFPDEVTDAIALHHDPFVNGSDNVRLPAVMFMANFAVQNKLVGFCDAPYQHRTLYQKCLIKYSLKEKAMDIILKEVIGEIIAMEKAGWF